MSNEILKNCEIITKMTQEMQNRTIRIFARLDANVETHTLGHTNA